MRVEVIFDSPNIRVRHVHYDGLGPLMVLFPSLDEAQSIEKKGFGSDLYNKIQRDHLSITCASNSWFQYPEMGEAIAAMQRIVESYEQSIGYGSSMGAYGALAFGRPLGLSTSIAIAPQFSVDPQKVPFEKRWMADRKQIASFPIDDLGANAIDGSACYVIYDPFYKTDAQHVRLIREAVQPVEIFTSFGGHLCAELVAAVGILRPAVEAICTGTFDRAAFTRDLRQKRGSVPRTWKMLAERAARDGNAALAERALARLAALNKAV